MLSKIKIIQVQCFFDTWRFDADFSDRSADWTPRAEVRGRLYPDHRGGQLLSPRLLQILDHIGCRSRCKPQNLKNSSFHYKEKKQWMYSKWVNKELFLLYIKFVLFISKRFLFLFWFNRSHFVVNYSYCDYSKMSIKLTEVWSVLRNTKIVSLKNNPGYLLAFKNC